MKTMNFVCIFWILLQARSALNFYSRDKISEGWWGRIHHINQLTLLANTEEYQYLPDFIRIKCELQREKRNIMNTINIFKARKLKIYVWTPKSFRILQDFKSRTRLFRKLLNAPFYSSRSRSVPDQVTTNDLFMSVKSFLHIHQIYGIRLRTGYEHDTRHGGYLNILCNLIVGIVALFREMYSKAVEWMEPLSDFQNNQEDRDFVILHSILHHISVQEHNRILYKTISNEYTSSELYKILSNLFSEPIKYGSTETTMPSIKYPPKFSDLFDRSNLHSKFTDLCKGNTIQSPKTQKMLKCYYEQYKHTYFFLKPLKVEQLSENPPITQFYEILGNKFINYLKSFKEVLIDPKTLYGGHSKYLGFENVATYARRNMQNYVYKNYPQFGAISEFLTGLKVRDLPGPLLWAEYTYGRMVGVHEDTAGEPRSFDGVITLLKKGEMLAALMFYIDIPEEGGQTPFLQAEVKAEALKGSAVFWMTSYRNGNRRKDVHHAGCPILHGNKIVLITPIWYNANWDRYKCSLKRDE